MQGFIFTFFALYVVMLFVITGLTSRKTDKMSYFTGNRKSPWFVVAYGMIGSSLSGVTFMSVPGDVYTTQFTYLGVVFGYILGYIVIGLLLLPLYYRLNVTSIYEYLGKRIGNEAHKTGALFFFLSRLLGSALRMYLVIFVLQIFVFDGWNIPIWATAIVMIAIILLYTFRGGIKTVVWTDTLQTTFMLTALILTITIIIKQLGMPFSDIWHQMKAGGHTQLFGTDWHQSNFFVKQIISGMFITIVMTGLDQDMMQKNLTCKNLKDAQRNMLTFSGILVVANALFLFLGGLLLIYAQNKGIDLTDIIAAHKTDKIYPEIAFNHLGVATALIFTIGLISAGYSSADGTLTALTTSVCYDLIHLNQITSDPKRQTRIRRLIHVGIAILFLITIIIFSNYHNNSLITIIFNVASYTYGPILGMFVFSIFTKRNIKIPALVPVIAILSPILCLLLNRFSEQLLWGYKFGFELLIVNGLLTFVGLIAISGRPASPSDSSSQNDLLS